MNKLVINILTICILISNSFAKEKVVNKSGIAFINGKPKYIITEKDDVTELSISKKYLAKIKDNHIKAARISFEENSIFVCDSKKEGNYYIQLVDSERIYKYKVYKNEMFISKDGNSWDRLYMKVIKVYEQKSNNNTIAIIYLKCKWFEGEYKILGVPDC